MHATALVGGGAGPNRGRGYIRGCGRVGSEAAGTGTGRAMAPEGFSEAARLAKQHHLACIECASSVSRVNMRVCV